MKLAFVIERGEGVDRAAKRIVRGAIDEAASLARDATVSVDERVHEVRVLIKRARATVALVADEAGPRARRDDRALRAIGRALGPSRDRVVAREALARLVRSLARRRGPAAVRRSPTLHRWLERALGTPDAEERLREAALALDVARGESCGWKVPRGQKAARAGFEAAYRRARRAFRRACEGADPVRFHAWRKAAKRLGYQTELLAQRAPGAYAPADQLKRLGRVLGDLHDLAVLRELLGRAGREVAPHVERDALLELVDEQARELRGDARALGAELFAERPRAAARRVRASWVHAHG
jgi:CHAD domain-containing protein